jgi:putative SOS response-associated peptidase YedK
VCGRFTQTSSPKVIAEIFHVLCVPELLPARYNVAPSQAVAVVRAIEGSRELAFLKWGLVPSWAKDKKLAPINAMAETAATKPMFRSAFKRRRCLIPADGWYDWQATGGTHKRPYFFSPKDGKPLALAGLWELWEYEGESLETCAILATDANEVAAPVNNRMPVILPADAYTDCLDPANQDAASLQDLLRSYPGDLLFARRVSTYVNNVKNQGPQCIQGVDV